MILKPADAAELIAQTRSDGTVLIGGQAVAFWMEHFGIASKLAAALTEDIDYLGTKTEARKISARLNLPHKLKVATFDDYTPNSAMLSIDFEGYPEPILVDYLVSAIGVDSKDIQKSAVLVEFLGEKLRVLHPMQLLRTKIWNLYRLEAKRTPQGIEQARLSIEIAAAFIEQAGMTRRELLNAIEAIGRFAATAPARFASDRYGLDCLKAIPVSVLAPGVLPEEFHTKRWPQIVAATR